MSQTIVVLGAGGRLGAALVREWRALGEDVLGLTREDMDISVPEQVHELEEIEFAAVVNCAALTNVDFCEQNPAEAMRINAQSVQTIAELCARKRKRFVQISTDYVFDGSKEAAYTEEDLAEPISHYGASKLAGEIATLNAWDRHLVARVSWVFGPDRPSFVDQILARAKADTSVGAVADKFAVPTYAVDVALMLRAFLFERPVGGILHVCNSGDCSWQEYAQHAIDCLLAAGHELKTHVVTPIALADLKNFIAKRPQHSVLSNQKLTTLTGKRPRSWRDAVREYVLQQASGGA